MKKSAEELHDVVLENLFALAIPTLDQATRDAYYRIAVQALGQLYDVGVEAKAEKK